MELINEFAAVPAITIICLIVAQIFKSATPDRLHRHIPMLCGILGCVISVISFLFIPGYIPAENLLVAIVIGTVSGWAATGVNQIKKQYKDEEAVD